MATVISFEVGLMCSLRSAQHKAMIEVRKSIRAVRSRHMRPVTVSSTKPFIIKDIEDYWRLLLGYRDTTNKKGFIGS